MNQPVSKEFYNKSKSTFKQYFPDNLTSSLWVKLNLFAELVNTYKKQGYKFVYFHCLNFEYKSNLPLPLKDFDKNLYFFLRLSISKSSEVTANDKCFYIHNIDSVIALDNATLTNAFSNYENGIGKLVKDTFKQHTQSSYLAECFEYPISKVFDFCEDMKKVKGTENILFDICAGEQQSISGNKEQTLFFVNTGLDNNLHPLLNSKDFDVTQTRP